jgi:putative chitinase
MRANEFVTEKRRRKNKVKTPAYGPGPFGMYGTVGGYSGAGGDGGGSAVGEDQENIKIYMSQDPSYMGAMFVNDYNGSELPTTTIPADTLTGFEPDSKMKDPKSAANVERIIKGIKSGDNLPPLLVRKQGSGYQVIDGHHRFWAQKQIGIKNVSVRIVPSRFIKDVKNKNEIPSEHLGEGWRDWVGGAALGATVAAGGLGAYDAYKFKQQNKEPERISVSGQVQDKTQDNSDFKKGIIRIAKDAVPKKSVTDSPHEKLLTNTAVAAGIKGEELAQFLAQTAHETMNFQHMVEIGGSLDFKKYEPKFVKDKTGKLIQVNPKAKTLGNVKKGDGARYKGRGYIQLTGRYNYKRAGRALGLPLEAKPELVEKPEIAAKVAVWFWQSRVQPKVDDFYDTRAATKPINPGLKGLDDRKEKFKDFKTVMK